MTAPPRLASVRRHASPKPHPRELTPACPTSQGHVECVRLLLAHGCSFRATLSAGEIVGQERSSLLAQLVRQCADAEAARECARQLLRADRRLVSTRKRRLAASAEYLQELRQCIAEDDVAWTALLYEMGLHPDAEFEEREGEKKVVITALMIAAHTGRPKAVQALLEASAEPTHKLRGMSALDYAKRAPPAAPDLGLPTFRKTALLPLLGSRATASGSHWPGPCSRPLVCLWTCRRCALDDPPPTDGRVCRRRARRVRTNADEGW